MEHTMSYKYIQICRLKVQLNMSQSLEKSKRGEGDEEFKNAAFLLFSGKDERKINAGPEGNFQYM